MDCCRLASQLHAWHSPLPRPSSSCLGFSSDGRSPRCGGREGYICFSVVRTRIWLSRTRSLTDPFHRVRTQCTARRRERRECQTRHVLFDIDSRRILTLMVFSSLGMMTCSMALTLRLVIRMTSSRMTKAVWRLASSTNVSSAFLYVSRAFCTC